MKNMHFDNALKTIMELLSETNAYVDSQAPWKLKSTDIERMKVVLYLVVNIIIKSSIMLYPFIPKSSIKALSFFNYLPNQINFENFSSLIKNDIIINKPQPLFPRID